VVGGQTRYDEAETALKDAIRRYNETIGDLTASCVIGIPRVNSINVCRGKAPKVCYFERETRREVPAVAHAIALADRSTTFGITAPLSRR